VTVDVNNNLTVNGTFTLTAGKIDSTGATIEPTGNCTLAATMTRTGGVIIGNLTLHYPTNAGTTSCVFHVGSVGTTAGGDYLPVTVAMTNVSSSLANSTVTVRTDAGEYSG
jgi:hypothetical protein